jgi:hypothetical protein
MCAGTEVLDGQGCGLSGSKQFKDVCEKSLGTLCCAAVQL